MVVRLLLLGLLVGFSAMCLVSVVECSLTSSPQNTVSVSGQPAVISCRSNRSNPVEWSYVDVNLNRMPTINPSGSTSVKDFYSSKNISLVNFDLVFAAVNLHDAGTYTCRETGTTTPDTAAAMLYVIDIANSQCNVSSQTKKDSSGNFKVTVICQVVYNGTDSGDGTNSMYPSAEWNDCHPAPNVSYTMPSSSTPYYRTFVAKADFSLDRQSVASTTCTYKVSFRSNVVDTWLDKRNPVFNWTGLVYNWTALIQDDIKIPTAAVGMDTTRMTSTAANGYHGNTVSAQPSPARVHSKRNDWTWTIALVVVVGVVALAGVGFLLSRCVVDEWPPRLKRPAHAEHHTSKTLIGEETAMKVYPHHVMSST